MGIEQVVLNKVETRLPKVIQPRTHGVIDYCHAAFFLGMALFWRKREPRAALAAAVTGSFILAESLLTDYPLGAAKVIPFEVHGKMDSAFAGTSFMIPKVFGFSESPAAKVFEANGFAEGIVVGMTNWQGETAGATE